MEMLSLSSLAAINLPGTRNGTTFPIIIKRRRTSSLDEEASSYFFFVISQPTTCKKQ